MKRIRQNLAKDLMTENVIKKLASHRASLPASQFSALVERFVAKANSNKIYHKLFEAAEAEADQTDIEEAKKVLKKKLKEADAITVGGQIQDAPEGDANISDADDIVDIKESDDQDEDDGEKLTEKRRRKLREDDDYLDDSDVDFSDENLDGIDLSDDDLGADDFDDGLEDDLDDDYLMESDDQDDVEKKLEEKRKRKLKEEDDLEKDMEKLDEEDEKDSEDSSKDEKELQESIAKITGGKTQLTEGFKTQVSGLLESAIGQAKRRIRESVKRKAKKIIEARTIKQNALLVEALNRHTAIVARDWLKENKIAVQSQEKVELAESIFSGLKSILEKRDIAMPQAGRLVERLESSNKKLKSELREAKNLLIESKSVLLENAKESIYRSITENLSEVQKDKFSLLIENVSYTSDAEYSKKLKAIKENAFSVKNSSQRLIENFTGQKEQLVEGKTVTAHRFSILD